MNDTNNKLFQINVAALLQDLGLSAIPDQEKVKIAKLVEQNISTKLGLYLESLVETEEEQKMLADAGDFPEIIIEYFAEKKNVDFPAMAVKFTHEVREELLQDVAYLRGYVEASQQKEATEKTDN